MKSSLFLRFIALAGVMFLGACGGGGAEVVSETTAGASAVDTAVVDNAEPLVAGPELVSGPAREIPTTTTMLEPAPSTTTTVSSTTTTVPSTTTTVPTVPSTTSTVPELGDVQCVAGSDFPRFDTSEANVSADMDRDGELDQVFLLDEADGLGHNGWVAVIFASGGIATGQLDGFFETAVDYNLTTVDLTNGSDGIPEILFVASSGPAISHVAVMALVDCSIVTTELFNKPFRFDVGAAPTFVGSGGCAFGTGGRIEFAVTEQNPREGEWTTTVYTLDGATWTQADRFSHRDFPDLESPTVLSLDDCAAT